MQIDNLLLNELDSSLRCALCSKLPSSFSILSCGHFSCSDGCTTLNSGISCFIEKENNTRTFCGLCNSALKLKDTRRSVLLDAIAASLKEVKESIDQHFKRKRSDSSVLLIKNMFNDDSTEDVDNVHSIETTEMSELPRQSDELSTNHISYNNFLANVSHNTLSSTIELSDNCRLLSGHEDMCLSPSSKKIEIHNFSDTDTAYDLNLILDGGPKIEHRNQDYSPSSKNSKISVDCDNDDWVETYYLTQSNLVNRSQANFTDECLLIVNSSNEPLNSNHEENETCTNCSIQLGQESISVSPSSTQSYRSIQSVNETSNCINPIVDSSLKTRQIPRRSRQFILFDDTGPNEDLSYQISSSDSKKQKQVSVQESPLLSSMRDIDKSSNLHCRSASTYIPTDPLPSKSNLSSQQSLQRYETLINENNDGYQSPFASMPGLPYLEDNENKCEVLTQISPYRTLYPSSGSTNVLTTQTELCDYFHFSNTRNQSEKEYASDTAVDIYDALTMRSNCSKSNLESPRVENDNISSNIPPLDSETVITRSERPLIQLTDEGDFQYSDTQIGISQEVSKSQGTLNITSNISPLTKLNQSYPSTSPRKRKILNESDHINVYEGLNIVPERRFNTGDLSLNKTSNTDTSDYSQSTGARPGECNSSNSITMSTTKVPFSLNIQDVHNSNLGGKIEIYAQNELKDENSSSSLLRTYSPSPSRKALQIKVSMWSTGKLSSDTADMILNCEAKNWLNYRGAISFDDNISQYKRGVMINNYQNKILLIDRCTKKLGFRLTDRTVKYIMAICCGMWIIDSAWLLDSINKKSLSEFTKYEIAGCAKDNILGGPAKARKAVEQNGSSQLFLCYEFVLMNSVSSNENYRKLALNEDALTWMIAMCGGLVRTVVSSSISAYDLSVETFNTDPTVNVIILSVSDRKREATDSNTSAKRESIQILSLDWLLDAISQQSIPRDLTKYLVDRPL